MLFSELFKIMVKKLTFTGFRGEAIAPPLDAPLFKFSYLVLFCIELVNCWDTTQHQ